MEGFLNRAVVRVDAPRVARGGVPACVLQLFRFKAAYDAPDVMEGVFDQMLKEYTKLATLPRITVAGRRVVFVERLRGTRTGLIAWWRGRDVTLLLVADWDAMGPVAKALLAARARS
jgi:hypothetical protein